MGRVGGNGRGQERFPRVPKGTVLHDFQECVSVPFVLQFHQDLVLSSLLISVVLVAVYHYLIMALIFLDD